PMRSSMGDGPADVQSVPGSAPTSAPAHSSEPAEPAVAREPPGKDAAWGLRALAALPADVRRPLSTIAHTARPVAPVRPPLPTAVVLVLLVFGFSGRLHNTYALAPRWALDYIDIGSRFASHIGLQQQALNRTGYDGQFNYYLALHPDLVVTCA